MTDMDMTGLDIVLVLLFAVLCAVAVLFLFLRLRHKYWPTEKAPFWFEVLQMAAIINAGMFGSRLVLIYLLPLF